MLPEHAICHHLSRYSPYHARIFARWYARDVDFVSLHKATIIAVVPSDPEQALVMDASFVPTSGQKTSSLDRFWNGSHLRTEQGLEISALVWLDLRGHCADCLSVDQTSPTGEASAQEAPRIDGYLEPLTRVVSAPDVGFLHDVVIDGYGSTQKFMSGVWSVGRHQMGKLPADAHLRYLYQGPKRPGSGRPKPYHGQVNWSDLSRLERVATEDGHVVLSHQCFNQMPFECNLGVVVVVDTPRHRRAVLLSTDVALDALTLYRDDQARFHVERLSRDAKPLTGLTDCQAHSPATLDFHFHTRLTAVSLAKLEARQQNGQPASSSSMASLKRRAFNQHLIDRIGEHLAKRQSLEKSSPDDDTLCHYDLMTELVAYILSEVLLLNFAQIIELAKG